MLVNVSLRLKFSGGIPKELFEFQHGIVLNPNTLRFEQLLHGVGAGKMDFPGKAAVPVDHPMSWNPIGLGVAGV